jgi:hypothetical protein
MEKATISRKRGETRTGFGLKTHIWARQPPKMAKQVEIR